MLVYFKPWKLTVNDFSKHVYTNRNTKYIDTCLEIICSWFSNKLWSLSQAAVSLFTESMYSLVHLANVCVFLTISLYNSSICRWQRKWMWPEVKVQFNPMQNVSLTSGLSLSTFVYETSVSPICSIVSGCLFKTLVDSSTYCCNFITSIAIESLRDESSWSQ